MTARGGDVLAWLDDAIRHREAWAEQAAAVKGPFWSAQSLGSGRRTVFYVGGSSDAKIVRMDSRLVTAEDQAVTPHIALNDPASVLRRCAADRKVMALHNVPAVVFPNSGARDDDRRCVGCGFDSHEEPLVDDVNDCLTLHALAEGYGWPGGER